MTITDYSSLKSFPQPVWAMRRRWKIFLAFGKENYPAKRTAVVFWNHGGGSVSGAAFDELYGMDSLSLAEMYQAFFECLRRKSAGTAGGHYRL
ncbi:MAG: clostripain-related cysteine peptidase [Acetivibrionales bacterium]